MKKSLAVLALSLGLAGGLAAVASAEPPPCISCIIAEQNAATQAAINRLIVQTQLQQDLQSRLILQQNRIDTQRTLNLLQIQSSLLTNDAAIRQILLQERLNLLRLQNATPTHKSP